MGTKLVRLLKGQIPTSVFFIGFGLCLVLVPTGTLNLLLKVVFGLLLIGAGLYQVWIYVTEKESATILDLFSGVIVLVIGGFLFTNPQIVIRLLPLMLGAFILVDSIWTFRGCLKLKKRRVDSWKFFLIESLVFIVLGGLLAGYSFQSVNNMIMFAGWVFLANGVLDVVFYILLRNGMKKEIPAEEEEKIQPETAPVQTEAQPTKEENLNQTGNAEAETAAEEATDVMPAEAPEGELTTGETQTENILQNTTEEPAEEPIPEWKD